LLLFYPSIIEHHSNAKQDHLNSIDSNSVSVKRKVDLHLQINLYKLYVISLEHFRFAVRYNLNTGIQLIIWPQLVIHI